MSSNREKMMQARELIRAKRYDEARRLLREVDLPQAKEWLQKLDQVAPQPHSTDKARAPRRSNERQRDGARLNRTSTPSMVAPQERSKLPIAGALLLLLLTIVGGISVGLLLFLSSKVTYILIVSVALAATLVGGLLILAVHLGKVRDVAVVAGCALLAGLLAYGAFRFAEYYDFREQVRQSLLIQNPAVDGEQVDAAVNTILAQQTGSTGLIGFISMQANEGMGVNVTSRYARSYMIDITLGRELTLAYWGLEVLIMAVLPIGFAINRARQPFCEDNNRWLKFNYLGAVPADSIQDFLGAIQQGHLVMARSMLTNGRYHPPWLKVDGGQCGDDSDNAQIKVTLIRPGNQADEVIFRATASRQQYNQLTGRSRD